MLKMNGNAFTLAEVLITLGIIGVVAALTIPAIIQKTYDSEWHVGCKKAYSILSNAMRSYYNDNGDSYDDLTADKFQCQSE